MSRPREEVSSQAPEIVAANASSFFQRIWSERKHILIAGTRNGSRDGRRSRDMRIPLPWLGVPLLASDEFFRILFVGHVEPNHFTEDHLRRA